MRAITSFSEQGYEQYGKGFLQSYVKHWPIPITVYYETEQPDFEHELITYKPLFEVAGCREFLSVVSTLPIFKGIINERRNYRFDVFKFVRKCFAQCDAASEEDDLLFWLDADTVWEEDINENFLRALLNDTFMCYLGRPDWHSCASFIGWNLKHKASDGFWRAYFDMLMSGKILALAEWHDCFLLDSLREGLHVPARDLAEDYALGKGPVNVFDTVFKGIGRHLKGNLKNKPQRYQQLIDLVIQHQPESIMEIGTWNGTRALEMIEQVPEAMYYGFDLFENANNETDEEEKNVKPHHKADDIAGLLQVNKVKAELYAGDTKKTLPIFLEKHGEGCIDFAFIDGGHSVETIKSDWENVKKAIKPGGVVVFDDYYTGMDDLDKFGANEVIKDLDYELLPIADPVKGGGKTQMAVVQC